MQVTSIDRVHLEPGTLRRWTMTPSGPGVPSEVPPSFNQSNHLSDTAEGTTWLAATFDVDGPIDVEALSSAFARLVDRHGSLRTGFVRTGDRTSRLLHPRGSLIPTRGDDVVLSSSRDTNEALRAALNDACRPFAFPSYLLAAVDRPDRSTVVCGFDHALVDALSLTVVVDEMRRFYASAPEPEEDAVAGCFVDYCAAEACAETVDPDDERMTRWLAFLRRHGNAPPTFPLPLGRPRVVPDRSAVDVVEVLTANRSAEFERLCRGLGASLYAGVLAAMGHAVRDLGGGDELPLLFPLHTRTRPEWARAIGWFVTNAPLDVRTQPVLVDTIRRTGVDLRRAVELGTVPIPGVVSALGGLRRPRKDVFMVSFVDYRRLPGHLDHRRVSARHISNVTVADDAQFWFSRTDDGVSLRVRYPDNTDARETITAFCARLAEILAVAGQPTDRSRATVGPLG